MMDAGCIDRVLDLSAAWKAAAEVFPYFEERGIDWDRHPRIQKTIHPDI